MELSKHKTGSIYLGSINDFIEFVQAFKIFHEILREIVDELDKQNDSLRKTVIWLETEYPKGVNFLLLCQEQLESYLLESPKNSSVLQEGPLPTSSLPAVSDSQISINKIEDPDKLIRKLLLTEAILGENISVNGERIFDTLEKLIPFVKTQTLISIVKSCRHELSLRKIPLFIVLQMLKHPQHKSCVAELINDVILCPKDAIDFLKMYYEMQGDGNQNKPSLASQIKKGLAQAVIKFSEEQILQSGNAPGIARIIKLCHPKPASEEQSHVFKRLMEKRGKPKSVLAEAFSQVNQIARKEYKGDIKKAQEHIWKDLLQKGNLDLLTIIRNIRFMESAGIKRDFIVSALSGYKSPYPNPLEFILASRMGQDPNIRDAIEKAMLNNLKKVSWIAIPQLPTAILIDVSKSMDEKIHSMNIRRIDAACSLAITAVEAIKNAKVFTFSGYLVQIPESRGFSLLENILNSQPRTGSWINQTLEELKRQGIGIGRLIVVTDDPEFDKALVPEISRKYMIDLSAHGLEIKQGEWTCIEGFSERTIE